MPVAYNISFCSHRRAHRNENWKLEAHFLNNSVADTQPNELKTDLLENDQSSNSFFEKHRGSVEAANSPRNKNT